MGHLQYAIQYCAQMEHHGYMSAWRIISVFRVIVSFDLFFTLSMSVFMGDGSACGPIFPHLLICHAAFQY